MPDRRSPAAPPPLPELLRTLIDKTSTLVAYWDADQRCRFANRAYELWFGVSPEALVGRHVSELLGALYPANRPLIEAALRGEPQEFERDFPDPKGGPARQCLLSYIPDIATDGVVRGYYVLGTDVSAVKRAERALRESEERFRLTIAEAPIGMAMVAPDGRFLRVNRALCEIVGYSAEELCEMRFQAITHPDDLDSDLALVGQLARGEIHRYQLGKRYVRKDGTIVDVMLSVSVLRDNGGAPLHFIAQIEDVSLQKRTETEQRLLAAIGPVFAASLDFDDTLVRIAELVVKDLADLCVISLLATGEERATQKVAGRDPNAVALSERVAQHPLDPTRPHLMRRVIESKQGYVLARPTPAEIDSYGQNDEHLAALRAAQIRSLVAVPLVQKDRLIGGILLVSSTPSRIYGPDDLRLAEELARRAALSIENARLYRAAQRASQARDDLLGIVAHDLRNPLNTIMLQAEVLQQRPSEERSMRAIHGMEHSVGRMQHLIDDLLDVARMESGALSVEVKRIAVQDLLTETIEVQRALAAAASLELRLFMPDDVLEVCADRDRLAQIFENLVGNAIKFTEPGGVITVTAIREAGEARFVVSDTGRGVSAEALAHLFDRFWQADRRDRRHGAGLGLPIVKGLVEAHHGRIWVESVEGRGTSVYFTIPLSPAAGCSVAATDARM